MCFAFNLKRGEGVKIYTGQGAREGEFVCCIQKKEIFFQHTGGTLPVQPLGSIFTDLGQLTDLFTIHLRILFFIYYITDV